MRPTCVAFCIWKALGFVVRLIHTDSAKNIISLDTEKLARKGLPACGGGGWLGPFHWKNGGGAGSPPPGFRTPMNFLKHLLTDWLGVSTVELCGQKKRHLGGILRCV